jgi:hypothetical protein
MDPADCEDEVLCSARRDRISWTIYVPLCRIRLEIFLLDLSRTRKQNLFDTKLKYNFPWKGTNGSVA